MRCSLVGAFCLVSVLMGAGTTAVTGEPLTTWERAKLIGLYPIAIHQLPLTTMHEGSHWLAARAFGDHPSIHLLPGYFDNGEGGRVFAMGYVEPTIEFSPAKKAIISAAPYLVRLLVVDRVVEESYRHGWVHPDTFGDEYIQASLGMTLPEPLTNTIGEQSDIARLAKAIHVNKYLLGIALQGAYIYSAIRINKARGHADHPAFGFYWRISF